MSDSLHQLEAKRTDLFRQLVEKYSTRGELFNDRLFPIGSMPGIQERVERCVFAPNFLSSVILQRFGDESPMCIKVLDTFGRHDDFDVIDEVFYRLPGCAGSIN